MKYDVRIENIAFTYGTRVKNIDIKVYDEDINFRSLKRKDSGFLINRIPMERLKDWLIVGKDKFKDAIEFPLDISYIPFTDNDMDLYFNVNKNMTSKIVLSQYYYLGKERVRVVSHTTVTIDGVDYDKYNVLRDSETRNTRQTYITPFGLKMIGYYKNTARYTYYLSNYMDTLEGLRVSLYNPNDGLSGLPLYQGVIKSVSVVNYGVTLDCKFLSESLDFNIPEEGLKMLSVLSYNNPTVINTSLGTLLKHVLDGANTYQGFSPFLNQTPPFRQLTAWQPNTYDMFSLIPNFILNAPLLDVSSIYGIDGGVYGFDDIPKINILKIIYIVEILTGWFLFTTHTVDFRNIYGKINNFKQNVLPHYNLKEKVVLDKFIVTPFESLENIEVSWKNNKTFYTMPTIISKSGGDKISIDLSFLERTTEFEEKLLDGFVYRHLYLNAVKISVLKVQVPFRDDSFKLGSSFVIDDIDEFFTFQAYDNNKYSNVGTVISREDKGEGKAELEIVVGGVLAVKPLAPFLCGVISNTNIDGSDIEFDITFTTDTISEALLFKHKPTYGDFSLDSPFEDDSGRTKWFEDFDDLVLYKQDDHKYTYIENDIAIIQVVDTHTLSLRVNNNTENYTDGSTYCISYANAKAWYTHFLTKGVDKWQN